MKARHGFGLLAAVACFVACGYDYGKFDTQATGGAAGTSGGGASGSGGASGGGGTTSGG